MPQYLAPLNYCGEVRRRDLQARIGTNSIESQS